MLAKREEKVMFYVRVVGIPSALSQGFRYVRSNGN